MARLICKSNDNRPIQCVPNGMLSQPHWSTNILQNGILISSDLLQTPVKQMWSMLLISVGCGADPESYREFRMKQDKPAPVPTVTELCISNDMNETSFWLICFTNICLHLHIFMTWYQADYASAVSLQHMVRATTNRSQLCDQSVR